MSRILTGLLCLAAAASALSVATLRTASRARSVQRASAPCALLPSPPLAMGIADTALLAVPRTTAVVDSFASVDLPSSVLVADIIDFFQGFAGSPFILLVPIGAGALVAAIIISILVKSAG